MVSSSKVSSSKKVLTERRSYREGVLGGGGGGLWGGGLPSCGAVGGGWRSSFQSLGSGSPLPGPGLYYKIFTSDLGL